MRRWLALWVIWALVGNIACALHAPTASEPQQAKPNTAGLTPFITNEGLAQLCPVGDYLALTARHVGAKERGDGMIERVSGFWSASGSSGIAWMIDYDFRRDLALMQSSAAFPRVYDVAPNPPEVGDEVTIAGYDFRIGRTPLEQRIITTTIINIVATHLVLKDPGASGFSGSCVLNQQSQVVGVFFASVGLEGGRAAGIAAGVSVAGNLADVGWVPPKG